MAAASGLQTKRLTNHSARKTLVQNLMNEQVPAPEVIQFSRHKNQNSINSYSRITYERQREVSLKLQGQRQQPSATATVQTQMVSRTQTLTCSSSTEIPASVFKDNTFVNCTFVMSAASHDATGDQPQLKKARLEWWQADLCQGHDLVWCVMIWCLFFNLFHRKLD